MLRAGLAASTCRQAGDVQHVLDGNWHAVQRTANAAGFRLLPQNLRVGQRPLAIDEAPALHLLLDGVNTPERGFDKSDRVGLSALNGGRDLLDRARIGYEALLAHGASFVLRRPAVSI